VLEPGNGVEPSGLGLGLLYSCRRSLGPRILMEILERTFPGRFSTESGARQVAPLVLCVDDDPAYLNSLTRLIRNHGYRVAPFEEALPALEAIPDLRPSVAVVDISMSGMDGFTMTQEIHTRFGDRLPVVLLTGRDSSSD